MGDVERGEVLVEGGAELGTVVGGHTAHPYAETTELAEHQVEEPSRDVGVRGAEEHVTDRPAGRSVDGGELPHRPDDFEVAV
jgi:hypothetical protein